MQSIPSQRNIIIAAIVALLVLAIVVFAVLWPRTPRDQFSSFQFWTWDPAYGSPPLQNPYEPHSQLFRALEGNDVQPPYNDTKASGNQLADIKPLQVSAAMTAHPDAPPPADEDFRGRWWRGFPRYAAPLWYAGPLARYRWAYSPYYYPGQGPLYYGSYPYYATF